MPPIYLPPYLLSKGKATWPRSLAPSSAPTLPTPAPVTELRGIAAPLSMLQGSPGCCWAAQPGSLGGRRTGGRSRSSAPSAMPRNRSPGRSPSQPYACIVNPPELRKGYVGTAPQGNETAWRSLSWRSHGAERGARRSRRGAGPYCMPQPSAACASGFRAGLMTAAGAAPRSPPRRAARSAPGPALRPPPPRTSACRRDRRRPGSGPWWRAPLPGA